MESAAQFHREINTRKKHDVHEVSVSQYKTTHKS